MVELGHVAVWSYGVIFAYVLHDIYLTLFILTFSGGGGLRRTSEPYVAFLNPTSHF